MFLLFKTILKQETFSIFFFFRKFSSISVISGCCLHRIIPYGFILSLLSKITCKCNMLRDFHTKYPGLSTNVIGISKEVNFVLSLIESKNQNILLAFLVKEAR